MPSSRLTAVLVVLLLPLTSISTARIEGITSKSPRQGGGGGGGGGGGMGAFAENKDDVNTPERIAVFLRGASTNEKVVIFIAILLRRPSPPYCAVAYRATYAAVFRHLL